MSDSRTLPELISSLRDAYPADVYLAGCLMLPMEPDDESLPPVVAPHTNCGGGAGIRTRAALVRSNIAAGRQHPPV